MFESLTRRESGEKEFQAMDIWIWLSSKHQRIDPIDRIKYQDDKEDKIYYVTVIDIYPIL